MLDVGCGPLRAGAHFIRYLNQGRYVGIDNNNELLNAGRLIEIPTQGLTEKNPRLRRVDDFDLSWLPPAVRFNFAIAQSLFTHLYPKQIRTCLGRVGERLAPGGTFYATFNPSKNNECVTGGKHPKRDELDWTYFPVEMFGKMAAELGLGFNYVGKWGHPLNRKSEQEMISFTKSPG